MSQQPPPPTSQPTLPTPFTYTTPPPAPLTQGAEAHLYKTHYLTPQTPCALKVRPSKPYRHALLDAKLTRQRILHEARCLVRLRREGVAVPGVLGMDWEVPKDGMGGAWLAMEWVGGSAVRGVVEVWEKWVKEKRVASGEKEIGMEDGEMKALLQRIGLAVGKMHERGVVHGDLTTSNLMLRPESGEDGIMMKDDGRPVLEGEIVLIDFGLAVQSVQDEDRAVDLYVLERAFGSTHSVAEGLFPEVLEGYRKSFKGTTVVLKRLEEVRMRGRKRSMLG